MPLSRRWTAKAFFEHAVTPLASLENIPLAQVQRFELINLVQLKVVSAFYAPMSGAYMTPAILQTDTAVNYSSASGSWTASSRRLAVPMLTSFSALDIGKTVVFRSGTVGCLGVIESFVNASTVILSGNSLPETDLATVDAVMVVTTNISNDMVSLASLAIMRAGDQVRLVLESSVTTDIVPVRLEELSALQDSDPRHTKRIAWCYSGDSLLLRTPMASYGALLLRYPRVPIDVNDDADYLDLPDGAPTSLAMVLLRKMIVERYMQVKVDMTGEIQAAVKDVMQNYGIVLSGEEIKKKVESLK